MALFLVEAGFVGFVACLFCAVWRGLNREGKRQRSFSLWLLSAALFFVLLIIGLRLYPIPWPQ